MFVYGLQVHSSLKDLHGKVPGVGCSCHWLVCIWKNLWILAQTSPLVQSFISVDFHMNNLLQEGLVEITTSHDIPTIRLGREQIEN